MKEHKVYHIRELNNSDLSEGYIGVTSNIKIRKQKHKYSGKLCLGREMVILYTFDNSDEAYTMEESLRPRDNMGMNLVRGGKDSGQIRRGQHLSKKTEFKKGLKPHNLGTGIKYKLTSPCGAIFYPQSLVVFCKELNLTPQNLRKVAKGERIFHKGWKAEYII